MKIVQIIGSRPNIIKFVDMSDIFKQTVIWTGQHYDKELKDNLLKEFDITIDYDLGETNLGRMISKIMAILEVLKPDLVIVYGDTRSALAGAIAANEYGIGIAHIEAGVRLGKMSRPEERIRILIDSISRFLFCPNKKAKENLDKENVSGEKFIVGDLLYENYLKHRDSKDYVLCTIHREENTGKDELERIIKGLKEKTIFPIHPRTKNVIDYYKIKIPKNIEMVKPVSFSELSTLIKEAKLVVTDSGGVQREAYFCGTPVRIVGNSEWSEELNMFGDGNTSGKIKEILKEKLGGK